MDEDTPLRWWQNGMGDRPCYLFGKCVWELKSSEVAASDKGIVLLFQEASERNLQKLNRLSSSASESQPDYMPEKIRVAAWRRGGGKCSKCGRRDQLDFEFILPPSRGGKTSPDNIRIVCHACGREPAPATS